VSKPSRLRRRLAVWRNDFFWWNFGMFPHQYKQRWVRWLWKATRWIADY